MKIVLEHLTKQFPARGRKSRESVTAVDNFNFEIPDGQLIGLLGPSGCGKSTTLNMICGLEKPTDGRILFGEEDVTNLPPENRGVGMVFQNYALYPHLTVKQNILFPLQNLKGKDKLSKDEMDRRVQNAAQLVQITELMDRRPSELSGGQQQRVAIARALVKMPRVLLLDEPLSNLDARLRLQTREEIRKIQRATKITTVFVTHDQEEAMSISDMIVVMKSGVVQQIGKPQDVYDSPVNLFVARFLGTPPINVFEGEIRGQKLYIGENAILDAPGISDQQVFAGIRPEGFVLDKNGPLCCQLGGVEVMGRDISVEELEAKKKKEDKAFKALLYVTVAISIVISIAAFMLLPYVLASLCRKVGASEVIVTIVEAFVKLALFMGYMLLISRMKDIQRTFMYHGAEHKCINCVENGKPLTVENVLESSRFHRRCGTSFLFLVMLVSIFLHFIFVLVPSYWLRLFGRLLMVPIVSGISFEIIQWAGRTDSKFALMMSKPADYVCKYTEK